jgi:tRNA dimethylallyltransferase
LVVIAGPTGSGKTGLGVELALRFNGEVINADSRYLYRGFTIGTAKPSLAERAGVPHHLIDILAPDEDFSLARYQRLANEAIADIASRGKLPLLVGGTPLYIKAVVEGWRIPGVPPHPQIRARLEAEVAKHGVAPLIGRLQSVDPVAAERCGPNPRRIVRALEIYEVTGQPMSELEGKGPRPWDTLELGLSRGRSELYDAIDRRVDQQIESGLIDEIRALLAAGISPDVPAFSSIGYRQLLPVLAGDEPLTAGIARIKHDTHRYVRHQETWLRSNPRLVRIDVGDPGWINLCVEMVSQFLLQPDPGDDEVL